MPPPVLLAFDTSAAHCAAAVLCGGQVLARRLEPMDKGQAERLMPLLGEVLAEAGLGWRDLAGLGVGIGPGNFTGVRISVSAARGLAMGLGIPAIGVSTFDALAEGLGPVLASVDARRGMVYLRWPAGAPAMVALSDPAAMQSSGWDVVGADADTLARVTGGRAVAPVHPVAVAIALVALARLATPQPRPAPLYLRSADAAPPSDPPPMILP